MGSLSALSRSGRRRAAVAAVLVAALTAVAAAQASAAPTPVPGAAKANLAAVQKTRSVSGSPATIKPVKARSLMNSVVPQPVWPAKSTATVKVPGLGDSVEAAPGIKLLGRRPSPGGEVTVQVAGPSQGSVNRPAILVLRPGQSSLVQVEGYAGEGRDRLLPLRGRARCRLGFTCAPFPGPPALSNDTE